MGLTDIELDLDEEQRSIRDAVHTFAAEVMRPAGRAPRSLGRPIGGHRPPLDPLGRLREVSRPRPRGPRRRSDPGGHTPTGADPRAGAGGAWLGRHGIGDQPGGERIPGHVRAAGRAPGADRALLRPRQPRDRLLGDHRARSRQRHARLDRAALRRPAAQANCIATQGRRRLRHQGPESRLGVQRLDRHVAVLFCTLDPRAGLRGRRRASGAARPARRRARQAARQARPARAQPGRDLLQRCTHSRRVHGRSVPSSTRWRSRRCSRMANARMGVSSSSGLARAAFEHALAYAKERVQGGVPIFEHQAVKSPAVQDVQQAEAARALARRVFVYNATHIRRCSSTRSPRKSFCTQHRLRGRDDRVQIFGGNGLSREYPVEKLLRDARASMIEDGCNECSVWSPPTSSARARPRSI